MTTLVRWAPFHDLDVAERRMRRMLEDFGVGPSPLPAADMYETEKELVVELEVPGFEEKELSLELDEHTLTVKGERTREQEEKDKSFLLRERIERYFERRFVLPSDVDTERLDATFHDGVLEVHVPKMGRAKPRKIEIST